MCLCFLPESELSSELGSSVADQREIVLPCENWSAKSSGYVYRDRDALHGGVREVKYGPGRLQIDIRGPAYRAIAGPVDAIELGFRVGAGSM